MKAINKVHLPSKVHSKNQAPFKHSLKKCYVEIYKKEERKRQNVLLTNI